MANRSFTEFSQSLEKGVVTLFMRASFGASGAVTLDATNSKGISTIVKTGTGDYTITLSDTYNRLFAIKATWDESGNAGIAPLGPVVFLKGNSVTTATPTIEIITGNYTNGAATNPASTEVLLLEIRLKNSSAF